MGSSPTAKKNVSVNLGINPEKYEHPCQVEDFNQDNAYIDEFVEKKLKNDFVLRTLNYFQIYCGLFSI